MQKCASPLLQYQYTFCFMQPCSVSPRGAGYLSSRPGEMLKALLQFACTVVESGAVPSEVLTYYLPNLFGPGTW